MGNGCVLLLKVVVQDSIQHEWGACCSEWNNLKSINRELAGYISRVSLPEKMSVVPVIWVKANMSGNSILMIPETDKDST